MSLVIDPNNPPTHAWAAKTARVRQGQGPVCVTLTGVASVDTLVYAKPGKSHRSFIYSKSELFATEAEAWDASRLIAKRELDWEVRKHLQLVARLNRVLNTRSKP